MGLEEAAVTRDSSNESNCKVARIFTAYSDTGCNLNWAGDAWARFLTLQDPAVLAVIDILKNAWYPEHATGTDSEAGFSNLC